MNLLFYTMATATSFCCMGMIAALVLSRTGRATSKRVAMILEGKRQTSAVPIRSVDVRVDFLRAISWLRERLGIADDPNTFDRFERAGLSGRSYRDVYLAARVAGPVLALGFASCISYKRTFWMLSLTGIAYLLPDMILKRKIKQRREKIRLSIPDAIDLLVICVDAGLGMDQAMVRVAQELGKRHPEVHQEFLRINREQRAGKLRIDAWQSMATRIELPEMDAFVNMLMQTERFGTPIARALGNFADGIRQKRRQRAEELAAKTTVKIIFPLVLCIFPSIFVVLLGPPGIAIARGMAFGPN
jgi:tight adherence protein C